jgi:ArsR family transcriptional regulator
LDEWRRRLEEVRVRGLECFAAARLGLGGPTMPQAEECARRLIELAPFRESGHRILGRTSMNSLLPVLQPMCCGPETPVMSHEAAADLAAAFKALADPTRVAIVNRLATSECCVCDLTGAFELAQPTVSHHLRLLRDAGLVEAERRGTWAYYRLVPEAIERLRGAFSTPSARFQEEPRS